MAAVVSFSTTNDLGNAAPPPDVLTYDFVVRSLRRRLWRAFQNDDAETALRAYQASKEEFQKWLQEEQELQTQRLLELEFASADAAAAAASKDKRGMSFSKRHKTPNKKASVRTLACQSSEHKKEIPTTINATTDPTTTNSIDHLLLVGVPILQSQMNPSEPFIADDFLSPYHNNSYDQSPRKELPDPAKRQREKLARKRSRKPRLAFGKMFRKYSSQDDPFLFQLEETMPSDDDHHHLLKEDTNMTTPLHEAARLGAGDFIRILLAQDGDPNIKNGLSRTALHMCSGGLTAEEDRLTQAAIMRKDKKKNNNKEGNPIPDGIRAPVIPPESLALLLHDDPEKDMKKKGTARKAARAVGKILQSAIRSSTKEKQQQPKKPKPKKTKHKPDPDRLNHIFTERMDAVLALLSWNHAGNGEGPSINAVDADGRTALHYAAEMGRSDVCTAILSNFGAMLTIVDDLGSRTPCELAGGRGFNELAAQLEARALLYIDPYGLDDELMATVLNDYDSDGDKSGGGNRKKLVAPFGWFETLSPDDVADERIKRIKTGRAKILKAIQQYDGGRDMKKIMATAAKVGLNAALSGDFDEGDGADDEGNGIGDKSDGNNDGDRNKDDGDGNNESGDGNNENNSNDTNNARKPDSFEDKPDGMKSLMASAEKVGLAVALGIETLKASSSGASSSGSSCDDKEDYNIHEAFSNLNDNNVEQFLSHHNWNVSAAIKIFRKDPIDAFLKAGIPLPKESRMAQEGKTEDRTCLICYSDYVEKDNWVQLNGCIHGFCAECVKNYIKECAASKMAFATVTCPHHECEAGMSKEIIDSLLSDEPDVSSRIQEASNEQFIVSAHDFRFCSHPGCTCVVKKTNLAILSNNGIDPELVRYTGAVCTGLPSNLGELMGDTLTYEGVEDLDYTNCRSSMQPKKAHRFCFACEEEVHWPVSCDGLEKWKQKIRDETNDIDDKGEDGDNVNELAQKMWIKANTRPCPECNAPIEKNDGCNHMTCTNPSCRHEFCWICRKDWKLHGTATGGFFRCNIWQEEGAESTEKNGERTPPDSPGGIPVTMSEVISDIANDQGYGTAIHSATSQWRQRQEMARFLHHYTRWEAHGESAALERKMGDTVYTRLAPVVDAAIEFDGSPLFNFGGKGLSFVHSAFTELSECRSVLKHSYAFSFFRYPVFYQFRRFGQLNNRRREKIAFERLQSELEMMTEQMSDIVARAHLRATQMQIMFLTAGAAEKRTEFTNLMFSILNEEQKEHAMDKAEKVSKSPRSSPNRGRVSSTRRYRHGAPSPLGALGRVVDDSWSPDNDNVVDNDPIRSTLDEFLTQAAALDPQQRAENATRMWACSACTYMNTNPGFRCAMCGGHR